MKNRSILLGCLGAMLCITSMAQTTEDFPKNRNLGLCEWPNRKWYVIQNLGK